MGRVAGRRVTPVASGQTFLWSGTFRSLDPIRTTPASSMFPPGSGSPARLQQDRWILHLASFGTPRVPISTQGADNSGKRTLPSLCAWMQSWSCLASIPMALSEKTPSTPAPEPMLPRPQLHAKHHARDDSNDVNVASMLLAGCFQRLRSHSYLHLSHYLS